MRNDLVIPKASLKALQERWTVKPDWTRDPVGWVAHRYPDAFLWSKQREMMESVRDNPNTVVKASHSAGKSWCSSMLVAWWIDSHPPGEAFVISSAPTAKQVQAVLWREINRRHKEGKLSGRMNQVEWYSADNELIAFGRKPNDYDPTAFQGIHSRYLLVVLDEACHDDKTEVLTFDGWRYFKDLDGTEQLLSMDPNTHKAEYLTPTRIIKKPYTGMMYEYTPHSGGNFCVTPDHMMYYKYRAHRQDDGWGGWTRKPIKDIAEQHGKYIKKSIDWDVLEQSTYTIPEFQSDRKLFPAKIVPMDEWMTFLGWYFSEGCIATGSRKRFSSVSISQKSSHTLDEIFSLCVALELNPRRYDNCVRIHSVQLAEHLASWGIGCLIKRIPHHVRHASSRQINLFLDSFSKGDGTKRPGNGGEILYTSNAWMADDLQELVLKTGVPSVKKRRALAGQVKDLGTHLATSTVDGWTVSRPSKSSLTRISPDKLNMVPYSGMVYCATVPPHHLLFTRRNGYTMWSGNCGIPEPLWDAASSLASNENGRIFAVGNPDDPMSYFAKVAESPDWNTIRISAFDTPNFTGEETPDSVKEMLVSPRWVEEKQRTWGETSPVYISKVLGEFPTDSEDGVIPYSWASRCQQLELPKTSPVELGLDVAAGGADASVVWLRMGNVAAQKWTRRESDPLMLADWVKGIILETEAENIKVDAIGVGWGVCGILDDWHRDGQHSCLVTPVKVSESAYDDEHHLNLRAEIWWEARERCRQGEWDLGALSDDDMAELTAPKYHTRNPRSRTQVESKAELRKRIGKSPDSADALLLAFHTAAWPAEDYTDYVANTPGGW